MSKLQSSCFLFRMMYRAIYMYALLTLYRDCSIQGRRGCFSGQQRCSMFSPSSPANVVPRDFIAASLSVRVQFSMKSQLKLQPNILSKAQTLHGCEQTFRNGATHPTILAPQNEPTRMK
jgi:hypothetical protein